MSKCEIMGFCFCVLEVCKCVVLKHYEKGFQQLLGIVSQNLGPKGRVKKWSISRSISGPHVVSTF